MKKSDSAGRLRKPQGFEKRDGGVGNFIDLESLLELDADFRAIVPDDFGLMRQLILDLSRTMRPAKGVGGRTRGRWYENRRPE